MADQGSVPAIPPTRISPDALYQTAGRSRNTDIAARWTITTIFASLNSGGIAFVINQTKTQKAPDIWICSLGFAVSLAWFILNKRIQDYIEFWTSRMEVLEAADPYPNPVFGSDEYSRIRYQPVAKTSTILQVVVLLSLTAWLIFLSLSIWKMS